MSANDTKYETGARKFPSATGPDPHDQFSQDAAKNAKPPLGMGLAERLDETNEKRPGDDQPRPVPGKDVPIEEPEVVHLPDGTLNPEPHDNDEPSNPGS